MIFRNALQNHLYEVDSTLGTPPPTPETVQEKAKDKDEVVSMTVDQLKRINAKEAKDAKAATEKAILEGLGVSSLDEIKTMLSAQREKQEAEKTESQKLNERLALLEKQSAEKDAKLQEVETQRRADKRDSSIISLLQGKTVDPNQVLILLKATHGAKLNDLLKEDGSFDKDAAINLIAEYQKTNGHLFKDERQGSAMSNRDGRAKSPLKDKEKAVARKTSKIIQGF